MRRDLGGNVVQSRAVVIDIQSSRLLANILLQILFHIFIPRNLTLYFITQLLH